MPPVEGNPDEEPAEFEVNANDYMMQDDADMQQDGPMGGMQIAPEQGMVV
jgi:hypothetical protein